MAADLSIYFTEYDTKIKQVKNFFDSRGFTRGNKNWIDFNPCWIEYLGYEESPNPSMRIGLADKPQYQITIQVTHTGEDLTWIQNNHEEVYKYFRSKLYEYLAILDFELAHDQKGQ